LGGLLETVGLETMLESITFEEMEGRVKKILGAAVLKLRVPNVVQINGTDSRMVYRCLTFLVFLPSYE